MSDTEGAGICVNCGALLPVKGGACPKCLLASGLLFGDEGNSSRLGAPVGAARWVDVVAQEEVGNRVGDYRLLQKIGEGGCGVVYMAEQQEPIKRRVALKVIKLGLDTKEVVARFEAERQALALMDHPGIAKVLDAGATVTGRPYFVMELVRGIKITDYCDQHKLTTEERLNLFLQVCHAVEHAHQRGIIHRDLKPANILVALGDAGPAAKVIDFGIAKATAGQVLTDKTVFTAFEQFIGTPAYVSPEQAEICGGDIDPRSDIYSLGVLLYELLTGGTPFDSNELVSAGLDGMRRIIREQEPRKPSTQLSLLKADDQTTVAKNRRSEPPKLLRSVRGDLDWIVMKCLEKLRSRRYETADALAMDIGRFLRNDPIVARPPTTAYRVSRLISRYKVASVAVGMVGISLLLVFASRTLVILQRLDLERQDRSKKSLGLLGLKSSQTPASSAGVSAESARETASSFAKDGNWLQAIRHFRIAISLKPDENWNWLQLGPALVQQGDLAAFNEHREAMLSRFKETADAPTAERVAKVYFLMPGGLDVEAATSLAERAVSVGSDHPWAAYFHCTRGVAEYRQNRLTNALTWLDRSLVSAGYVPDRDAQAYFISAMAHYKLGHKPSAISAFANGREIVRRQLPRLESAALGEGWHDVLIANIFMCEALNLMRGEEPIATQVNLDSHFNARPDMDWHNPDDVGNNLKLLPLGLRALGPAVFDIKGVVQLASRQLDHSRNPTYPIYPTAVGPIPVNRNFSNLDFLHGAGWPGEDGSEIASYTVTYSDQTEVQIPIRYGQDVRNWQFWPDMPEQEKQGGNVAWFGEQERWAAAEGFGVRLYWTRWQNPHSEKSIEKIDLVSRMEDPAYFLLAISGEP